MNECGYALFNDQISELPNARCSVNGFWTAPLSEVEAMLRSRGLNWGFEGGIRTLTCEICGLLDVDAVTDGAQCDPAKHRAYYDAFSRGTER